jgi:WD40 repeat protein
LIIYEAQEEKVHEVLEDNNSTITTLASDLKNSILATGTKSGCLTIYSLLGKTAKLIKQIHDHDAEINDICICQDLKAILTCSSDGWAHLYNMFTGKYFRSF